MPDEVNLLKGNGEILKQFSVVSIHELGGLKLRCERCWNWSLEWPAHVRAPLLLEFSIQAQRHWNTEHSEEENDD